MNPDSKAVPARMRLISALVFVGVLGALVALAAPASEAEDQARPAVSVLELSKAIDGAILDHLEAEGVEAAPISDDAEFLRRLYLDLVGTVPTVEEVRAFLADTSRDKRQAKMEALLASEAHSEHFGVVWFKATTGLSPAARTGRGGQGARYIAGKAGETYLAWLQDQMGKNRPYDEMVSDLITANGRTDENGAAGFLARWSENVNNLASATSKVFLGTRIQCAQCHDHIYEPDWKQKDFQGMAAFFATTQFRRVPEYQEFQRLRRQMEEARAKASAGAKAPDISKGGGDGMDDGGAMDGMEPADSGDAADEVKSKAKGKAKGKGKADRPGIPGMEDMTPAEVREAMQKYRGAANLLVVTEQAFNPRQVEAIKRGMDDPRRKKKNEQAAERFRERMILMTTTPKFWLEAEAADIPGIPRRLLLARWMTSPDNKQLARAVVNRYWGLFMGHGFVDPVDDFGSFNEASHPELLELLADDLIVHGYDLRRLVRIIVSTDTYQRTSRWTADEEPNGQLFAKAPVRPLTTEQLYHSLVRATGLDQRLDRQSRRNAQRVQQTIFSTFSFVFDDDESKEEQDFEGSIPQGLFLMNGSLMQQAVGASRGSVIDQLLRREKHHGDRVEYLYLSAFGRAPESREKNAAVRFVESQGGNPQAYEDLWWALLNSAEFMTNH